MNQYIDITRLSRIFKVANFGNNRYIWLYFTTISFRIMIVLWTNFHQVIIMLTLKICRFSLAVILLPTIFNSGNAILGTVHASCIRTVDSVCRSDSKRDGPYHCSPLWPYLLCETCYEMKMWWKNELRNHQVSWSQPGGYKWPFLILPK